MYSKHANILWSCQQAWVNYDCNCNSVVINYRWHCGVVVRALDLRSAGREFDSRPLHCRVTTLGKLFTPMCLCSPSSIIWYLARASMLTRMYVAAIHGSGEQGEYCGSGSAAILIV